MLIGEKIRKVRDLKGYSQEYIAKELGISQKTFSKIESNQSRLDFTTLDNIATILGVELMQLLLFNDKEFFEQKHLCIERNQSCLKYFKQLEAENKFLKHQINKLIENQKK